MRLHNNAQGAYTLFFVMRLFGVYMQIVCLGVFGGRCVGKQVGLQVGLFGEQRNGANNIIDKSVQAEFSKSSVYSAECEHGSGWLKQSKRMWVEDTEPFGGCSCVLCICNVGFLVGDFRHFPLF